MSVSSDRARGGTRRGRRSCAAWAALGPEEAPGVWEALEGQTWVRPRQALKRFLSVILLPLRTPSNFCQRWRCFLSFDDLPLSRFTSSCSPRSRIRAWLSAPSGGTRLSRRRGRSRGAGRASGGSPPARARCLARRPPRAKLDLTPS